METDDNIINFVDIFANNTGVEISHIAKPEPDFNGNLYAKPIVIHERFKEVVLKMCPEIKDIVSNGYRDNKIYDPMTFNPVYKYLVGVDLYFDETNGMKKSKKEYGDELNDYFKMTFDGMDFVSFHVRSFIFPP
jgi:hypothetical protein